MDYDKRFTVAHGALSTLYFGALFQWCKPRFNSVLAAALAVQLARPEMVRRGVSPKRVRLLNYGLSAAVVAVAGLNHQRWMVSLGGAALYTPATLVCESGINLYRSYPPFEFKRREATGEGYRDYLDVVEGRRDTLLKRGRELLANAPSSQVCEWWMGHLGELTQYSEAMQMRLVAGLGDQDEFERYFAKVTNLVIRMRAEGDSNQTDKYHANTLKAMEGSDDHYASWQSLFFHPEGSHELKKRFLLAVAGFRTHFLCRYRDIPGVSAEDQRLLELDFIHGTNSSVLPNLTLTDFAFVPFGRLNALGVVPLCGELEEGASETGVNQHHLSGCILRDIDYAKRYARGEKIRLERSKERIKAVIDSHGCTLKLSYDQRRLPPIALHIKRLRLLDSKWLKERRDRLIRSLGHIQSLVEEEKGSIRYREQMHADLDPDGRYGFQGASWSYANFMRSVEAALKDALAAFDAPLQEPTAPTPEETFGFLIASSSTYWKWQGDQEGAAVHPLRLGREVKVIFCDEAEKLQPWLDQHGLDVTIYPIAKLDQLKEIHREQAHYLYDIFQRA